MKNTNIKLSDRMKVDCKWSIACIITIIPSLHFCLTFKSNDWLERL